MALDFGPFERRVVSETGTSKFMVQINNWCNLTMTKLSGGAKAAVAEFFRRLLDRSPVSEPDSGHSGRFKGNWDLNDRVPSETYDPNMLDPDGAETFARMLEVLDAIDFADNFSIWISNHAPYAVRLEYSWSDQAPAGMVRITSLEWVDILRQVFIQGGGGLKSPNEF